MSIAIDDTVTRSWGKRTAQGEVMDTFTDRVRRTLKGTQVVRDASANCPALLIRQDDGDAVLKSISEVDKG